MALGKMLRVAEHINAMKKRYDAATLVQELQHLLRGWEVSCHKDTVGFSVFLIPTVLQLYCTLHFGIQ